MRVKKASSFRRPFTFDLRLQTRSGWKQNRKNPKDQRFGGLHGVEFMFDFLMCKSVEKCYNSPVNKAGGGQAAAPCSLVKKEGLQPWQESLFHQWRNAHYSAPFRFIQLVTSLSLHVEEEQPSQSLLGATPTPPAFVFILYGRRFHTTPLSCSDVRLDSPHHSFLPSHHASLTRCRYRCPSQTIAPGSIYRYAARTR